MKLINIRSTARCLAVLTLLMAVALPAAAGQGKAPAGKEPAVVLFPTPAATQKTIGVLLFPGFEMLDAYRERVLVIGSDELARHTGRWIVEHLKGEYRLVGFADEERTAQTRWLGLVPRVRRWREPVLAFAGLEPLLAAAEGIGPPDYLDDGMIQYLRAERIVAPYQTRGLKVVEMVRLYPVGTVPRA